MPTSTYEIEMDDGSVYEVDIEEPSAEKPITPKEKTNPAQEYLKFIKQSNLGLLRGATGGIIPKSILPEPDPSSVGGMIGQGVGAVAGFGKVRAGVLGAAKLANLASNPLMRLGASSVAGAAMTPDARGLGAVGGGLGEAIFGLLPKVVNLGGRKTAQAIAQKADRGFEKVGEYLSTKYDELFSNIQNGKASSKDIVQSIDETLNSYPEAPGVSRLKVIKDRIAPPKIDKAGKVIGEGVPKELTAKELHELKQEIRKTIPRSVWNGTTDADAIQHSQQQIYWNITKKLEDLGGEKYKGLTEEYRKFKTNEKLARKFFYEQGVPSDLGLDKPLSLTSEQAIKKLSAQLNPEDRFAQEFLAFRRGQAVKKGVGRALPYLGIGGGALYGASKMSAP